MIIRDDIPLGYTYDSNGNTLTFKDIYGYWFQKTYDSHGNLLSLKNADGLLAEKTYDSDGNELTYRDNGVYLTH